MNRSKRYCLYRAIIFLLLLSLILIFREREKSFLPLIILFSFFILDETFVLFVQRKVKIYNFLLDVTYISFFVVFTGSALSPFVPFYLPLIILSAYLLAPVDSFMVSGYSILSFGMISLFFTEKIPTGFILINQPEMLPQDIILIEFIVYSFVFIFTAAVSSLVVQFFRRQLIRFKVDISDIVESIDYGIIAVDKEGDIVWSNSKASHFLGVPILPGKNILEVTNNPFKEPIEKILMKENRKLEFEVDDRTLMIRNSGLFEGEGMILIINDRTEEKEIERKMQTRDKLVTLGNFAASLAHEVRNPVSSIRASAELIGPSVKGDVNKNKRLKEVIMRESDRLDYLVESFLDFTKSFNLTNKELDISKLMADVVSELKGNRYFNKGVKIRNLINGNFSVKGDYNLLKSVFLNLGINSLKAMPEGGELVFGTRENNGRKVFFVKDNGCGIKKKDLNKIFSPFHTNFKEGFGFGLAIVKKVLELHDWEVGVSSVVGEGTEIRIII